MMRAVLLVLSQVCLFAGTSHGWVATTSIFRQSGRAFGTVRGVSREADRIERIASQKSGDRLDLKLLLIDHHDSFTYNLVDLLNQFCVQPPTVVSADCYKTWAEFMENQKGNRDFDGIVLSPGPGHPGDDMCSLSRDCVLQNNDIPILGVCLGHQILGRVYGASVIKAPEPVHGQIRGIRLLETAALNDHLWKGVKNHHRLAAMRYHSLQVSNVHHTELIPTAMSDDEQAIVMALRHSEHPHYGVQFHPESIGTEEIGPRLLQNFVEMCLKRKQSKLAAIDRHCTQAATLETAPTADTSHVVDSSPCHTVYVHKVPNLPPNGSNMQPIDVMNKVYRGQDFVYWLDSSRADARTAHVSILGSSRRRVEYWGCDKPVDQRGVYTWDEIGEVEKFTNHDILSYLDEQHGKSTDSVTLISFDDSTGVSLSSHAEESVDRTIPFQFRGGHVGYLGYEVRHDAGRYLENETPSWPPRAEAAAGNGSDAGNPNVPTAAFLWADKSFVFDHQTSEWYLVQVLSSHDSPPNEETFEWMRSMSTLLQNGLTSKTLPSRAPEKHDLWSAPMFVPNRKQSIYNRNFEECINHIRNGESYELCLTNQLEALVRRRRTHSSFDLYSILRRRNPAPFSAFFNWNGDSQKQTHDAATSSSFAICCSSPERFVSVKQRATQVGQQRALEVEAKPIKGTIARVLPSEGRASLTDSEQAQDDARVRKLQTSIKDRAENLMIVDLLRNDLNRVCEPGSVHVANLTAIESFATVHQMVSTIRGKLNPKSGANAIDVLKACFPGGSMTGAPKRRSMELLNEMEEGVSRGPYSGCLGYISLNGCMDMNIVIRTAVLTPVDGKTGDANWKVSIGAGGAITALSESTDEYDEMMLKASAVMKAVQEWATMSPGNDMTIEAKANALNISVVA